MKSQLLRIVTVLAILGSPFVSKAQSSDPAGPFNDFAKTVNLSSAAFTAITMGSAREFDAIKTQGYSVLTIVFDFTWNAASAVTMTCKTAQTSDGTFRSVQVLSYSGTTAASDVHTWSQAVSASEAWQWTISILPGYNYVKCTVTATGGGSSDLLTLTAFAR